MDPGVYCPSSDQQQSQAGAFVARLTVTSVQVNAAVAAAGTVGATVASGTAVANIVDSPALTGGESPTEAEHNALAVKLNLILDALEAFKIMTPAA